MINCRNLSDLKIELIFDYDLNDVDNEVEELIKRNISMLGIYLSYLESQGIEYKVNSRPNNKFYINQCAMHATTGADYPFVIYENEGLFLCHGCNNEGSIINFVMEIYNLDLNTTIQILLSFINNSYTILSQKSKELYDQIFSSYSLKDRFLEISKEKTKRLNGRIFQYLEHLEEIDEEFNCVKISKRLSCAENYVRKLILNKK